MLASVSDVTELLIRDIDRASGSQFTVVRTRRTSCLLSECSSEGEKVGVRGGLRRPSPDGDRLRSFMLLMSVAGDDTTEQATTNHADLRG